MTQPQQPTSASIPEAFSLPSMAECKEVKRGTGRPNKSESVGDVILHPSAMSFCDESSREKLLLLREYRRFDFDSGLCGATDPRNAPKAPTHPLLKVVSQLVLNAQAYMEKPTVYANLYGRAAAIMSQIEKMVSDTQQTYIDNQLKMVRLVQQGEKNDLDSLGNDLDTDGMDEDELIALAMEFMPKSNKSDLDDSTIDPDETNGED